MVVNRFQISIFESLKTVTACPLRLLLSVVNRFQISIFESLKTVSTVSWLQ